MVVVMSDPHFTANPDDVYRWDVLREVSRLTEQDKRLLLLGDLADRKDRHPGDLVNRLIEEFTAISEQGVEVTILLGNHDAPMHQGKPYWVFLNKIPNITFIHKPHAVGKQLFLPYTPNPKEEWRGIDFFLYRVVFCHLTLKQLESGVRFPRGVLVFSGDEHCPRYVHGVTYVGAPHPVKYNETYNHRILILDDETFDIVEEVPMHSISKRIIQVSSAAELREINVHRNDMAKVRLTLPLERLNEWQAEQAAIGLWARQKGVVLAGVEPIIESGPRDSEALGELTDDTEIMAAFADSVEMDEDMLTFGLDLIEEAKGAI